MLNVFCSPSRYVQGPDATLKLGSELNYLNIKGTVLVIATKKIKEALEEKWKQSFFESNHNYFIHIIGHECTQNEIDHIIKAAQDCKASVIVGTGGGKTMDAGRAAAATLKLPVVNCPTIASSDAPCSALSIIYTEKGEVIEFRIYPKNPDLVLVDTTIVAQAPFRFLVAGMGDALSTLFEAKTCVAGRKMNMRGGGPTNTSLALAELCYKTLIEDGLMALESVKAKSATPALERIVEANTLLSGLGFESSGLAAAHAIHNGLTMVEQTHAYLHGEKVAFGTLTQLILEGAKTNVIEEVLNFSSSVGLPITFKEIGIFEPTDLMLDKIVTRTLKKGETIYNEPFEITPKLLKDALLTADQIGRAYLKNKEE
jgi:glycerol dehydrogenase